MNSHTLSLEERVGTDAYLLGQIEELRHLLPSQAPIRRFVHHNTLHHFEEQPFHQAVLEAHKVFGCEPYPKESFFAEHRSEGRIRAEDIRAVLEVEDNPYLSFNGWRRRDFREFRLDHLFSVPDTARVRYLLEEGSLLLELHPLAGERTIERFPEGEELPPALSALWQLLLTQAVSRPTEQEQLTDPIQERVMSILIRYCGAYLDQGIGYWPMPLKNGLYYSFLQLYSQPGVPVAPWFKGLSSRLATQLAKNWTAVDALADALERLGVSSDDCFAFLKSRVLSLKGWAGMVSLLEQRPDLAPIEAPPVRLQDYLAIYLQLEAYLCEGAPRSVPPSVRSALKPDFCLAYEGFCLAQLAGLTAESFEGEEMVREWLREVREFDSLQRRAVLLEAYERRYRNQVLDGLQAHLRAGTSAPPAKPRFQAVFCIDDREESVRRHLEETCDEVETLGYAGFYGVAMAYQGLTDPHSVPLCPPSITPRHLVREILVEGQVGAGGRTFGGARQALRASRNSFALGGALSAFAGVLAGVPLVGQTLFPGLFHRFGSRLASAVNPGYRTRLRLQREEGEGPNEAGYFEGFTVEEMVAIVSGAFKTMGVTRFAPFFIVVGHGSSSLNNPHEAAHDCGATGGGRGGPNARAFAAMANHPEVREGLARLGHEIPDETCFVGAYHNTCDDSMTYYDLDLMSQAQREELEGVKKLLHQSCCLDAHERCRRFENMPLKMTPEKAFRAVTARAVTLSQTRPEYGHSTNSLCVVGRRERTRGLFLDRRAFLVSYDPTQDPEGEILGALLESVGPVGAGINLEYYFSTVDAAGYGCGTKLPHNVSGLLGVMDGHASDLRTGLPWQMVDIHEPMRLLNIVEAEPEVLRKQLLARPGLKALVDRGWIQLVAWSPGGTDLWLYRNGAFELHVSENDEIPTVNTSMDYYQGRRGHLAPARIAAGLRESNLC